MATGKKGRSLGSMYRFNPKTKKNELKPAIKKRIYGKQQATRNANKAKSV
jgi:hypothetical protein